MPPPAQCPECGRFLAMTFVKGLATAAAPCPKCETLLSATQFPEALGQDAAPDGPGQESAAAADQGPAMSQPDPGSVRPPDLDPGRVRADDGPDPLAGWDLPDAEVVQLDSLRAGRQPPPDAAIVGGAAIAGAVIGGLLTRRRVTGATVGFLAGAATAATVRQVWRLPD